MRGECDRILVHNFPHSVTVFGDTVYLDCLPKDLVLLMRLEFVHVFSWEDRVFQALLGWSVVILMKCETEWENKVCKVENLRMR